MNEKIKKDKLKNFIEVDIGDKRAHSDDATKIKRIQ